MCCSVLQECEIDLMLQGIGPGMLSCVVSFSEAEYKLNVCMWCVYAVAHVGVCGVCMR